MRLMAAMALCVGLTGVGCGAGDEVTGDDGGDKADRPTAAADRGEIEIGTTRRARITEGGQTHAFELKVAAGAVVDLSAYPIASQEKTLKTTLKLYGPVAEGGALPARPLASVDDGTFGIHAALPAAGEYRIVVGAATRKMVGSYDLHALCSNLACHPEPVKVTARKPQAALAHAADTIECGSGCFGEIHAYVYDDGRKPSAAALTEAVEKDLAHGDEDWNTLETLDGDALEKELHGMKLDDLLQSARDFAGARVVEAVKVHGIVQIVVDDSGTDGFDQDLYLLHFPDAHAAVALLIKD